MSHEVHYRLYGLEVVFNRAISHIQPSDRPSHADLVCHLGHFPVELNISQIQREQPIYVSRLHCANGLPILQVWRSSGNGHYFFRYGEGVSFLFDGHGRQLWAEWEDGLGEDLVSLLLLGQVIGFILHLHGYVCLHASSVVIDERAVLFAGGQGRGKSSTAAAFGQRGCPVLSDDFSPIQKEENGQLVVVPGLPRVCLWPDSTEFLYGEGAAERLPQVLAQEEKRLVLLDARPGQLEQEPVPLGAIYLLGERSDEPTAPRIEPVETPDRLIQLLPNGFVSSALDSGQRASEFEIQGEISRSVPVQRLVPSSDPGKLGQLCDLVLNDRRAADLSFSGKAH